MQKKNKSIPVNMTAGSFGTGISVSTTFIKTSHPHQEVERAHRDDYHLFLIQQKGTTTIEIDFREYTLKPSTVVYIHPSQVHRVGTFKNSTFSSLAINNENLGPGYLELLEGITPVKPLVLKKEVFSIVSETVSLCIKFSERKNEKLYHAILKDGCNTLVGYIASQYLAQSKPADKFSRFEVVTKNFKATLEQNFATVKSPMAYAGLLNISTPYLNECVKNTTGHSVSYHIQQRVILEAERLLYHSDKSIKEIATELGYDDHSYFTRLFSKVAGLSPQAFRNKNRE